MTKLYSKRSPFEPSELLDVFQFDYLHLIKFKSTLSIGLIITVLLTTTPHESVQGKSTLMGETVHELYEIESNNNERTLLEEKFSTAMLSSCNGTPVGGLARISHDVGCFGVSFQLELSALAYSFNFDGLSYQWQQSNDGINWNNLPGMTDPQSMVYITNQTSYFRLSVLCSNSGETGFSNVVSFVTQNCESYNINAHNVVNTCSALFYDSGGLNGNYSNNEDHTITFCSASGEKMRVEFLNFNTQDNDRTGRNHVRNDILYVYDGPNVDSPPLFEFAGIRSAVSTVPVAVSSGRCITFRFRSDNAVARLGWEAVVTCTTEENRTASQFCETAPNICNLDGYFGTTSNFYNVESVDNQIPGGFFTGMALDNTSFITFVAEATVVEVDIWVGNCTPADCGGGTQGIQLGVIEGKNCRFSRVLANYGRGISPGSERLRFTGLTPGEVYYLFVDGFNCSNCQYRINALSGIALAQVDFPTALICEDEEITITASGGTSYIWKDASGNIISNGRSVTVSNPGIYQVVIIGGNPLCPDEVTLTSTIFTEFCCPEIAVPEKPIVTSICVGDEIPELIIESLDPNFQQNWYDAPSGGNLLQENSNKYVPSISSEEGSYIFYVSNQLPQSDCFSSRIPVELIIKDYREALFDTLDTYCIGKKLPELPTISINNINGAWSPPSYSIDQTEYVFTPFSNECSFTLSINIESEIPEDPIFSEYDAFCSGEPIAALPVVSNNGISGTWTPDINNLTTTTYVFEPNEDLCASRSETTITILQNSTTNETTKACDRYEWNGETYTQSGIYEYLTTNALGCDSTVTLQLTIFNSDFTTDSIFACDSYIKDGLEIKESGTYIYNSFNSVGCDSTSTVVLEIVDGGIYRPNIFRAESSSINNCFRIGTSNQNINRYDLTIYDRWGNMVFKSDSIDECWDGSFKGIKCAMGVYTYLLIINDPGCGLRKITGDVTLVR